MKQLSLYAPPPPTHPLPRQLTALVRGRLAPRASPWGAEGRVRRWVFVGGGRVVDWAGGLLHLSPPSPESPLGLLDHPGQTDCPCHDPRRA